MKPTTTTYAALAAAVVARASVAGDRTCLARARRPLERTGAPPR